MGWSGVVGVAGTQCCTQTNERPQQAAYSSNKIFILLTKPAQIQQTYAAKHLVSAGCKESKQTVQRICSSKQPNQRNLCVLVL